MIYHYFMIDGKLKEVWRWNLFAALSYARYLKKQGCTFVKVRLQKDGFHVFAGVKIK